MFKKQPRFNRSRWDRASFGVPGAMTFRIMFTGIVVFIALVFIAVIGGIVFNVRVATSPSQYVTATVTQFPQRECHTDGSDGDVSTSCRWLVYTPGEVFSDEDNILQGKWNSADVANTLQPNRVYCLRVNGIRNNVMSLFRNILSATPGACSA